jgi:hypothetical protein
VFKWPTVAQQVVDFGTLGLITDLAGTQEIVF